MLKIRFKPHFLSKKQFQVMKYTILFLFLGIFSVSAESYAQKATVSMNIRNGSIYDVVSEIEKQTEFLFFYKNSDIDNDIKVTVRAENKTVPEVLTEATKGTGLAYTVNNKHILIAKKSNLESQQTGQTGKHITGTVTDAAGEPIIGASITIKGTTNGNVTDFDGKFTLEVPDNAVLQVSYIGYITQDVPVGNQTNLNITLLENNQELEEVVVIGFGTQKKVNLVGAVAAVKVGETLASRSVSNVSSGLQGLLPGLAVSQNSGMAGKNDVTLLIRGMGTVNNANPLIVVDGMPDADINRLNMTDIDNISVLKDAASASVYGSRAANGVILITTKSGKGQEKTSVNFSSSYGISYPTDKIQFLSNYPRALTLSQRNLLPVTAYTQLPFKNGTIDEWLALGMIDPVKYPNTDWWDWILRDNGAVQNYNLSASGSNEKSNFYASIGVRDEKGLQINNDFSRYNMRFNYDYKMRHNMTVGIRFSGDWSKYRYFEESGFNASGNDIRFAIAGITPYDPETGYFGGTMAYGADAQAYNPYTYYVNNLNHQNRQEANGNMYFEWEPLKGLKAHIDYSLRYYNQFRNQANTPNRAFNFQTGQYGSRIYVGDDAGIGNYTNAGYKTQLHGQLNYETTIASHHSISAMAAYNEEYWYSRSQGSTRTSRLHPTLSEVDAALQDVQTATGNATYEGLLSYIGRVNYSAYDRYLLELDARIDGSSRFLPGHQYGFFPSIAVAWRFTEEDFIKKLTEEWLSSGKFRISFGSLGNNSAVGLTEQLEVLAAANYMNGNNIVKGFVNKKMINRNLSWEVGQVTNFGLDLSFLQGKLSADLDYYDRFTSGMIQASNMSLLLTGAYDAPRQNIGNLRNRGVEANLTWRDKKGEIEYSVNANFSKNWTQLEKWNEYLEKGWVYVDMPYQFTYTYEDAGYIAQTWQDIYSHTPQSSAPGDLMLKDVNGDGRIDANDKVAKPAYQRARPTTNYAATANVAWKGFDLSVMFQGTAGRQTFWITDFNNVNVETAAIIRYAYGPDHWDKAWLWDNRDGGWPRLGGNGSANRAETSYWLDNSAYLRLKNVQLGYTMPKAWMNRIGFNNIRIYLTGENLATFTKFRGVDPELGDVNALYPLLRSYSIGINIGI
jgi:TonB-linked SusC/RagA family outer membrane protein